MKKNLSIAFGEFIFWSFFSIVLAGFIGLASYCVVSANEQNKVNEVAHAAQFSAQHERANEIKACMKARYKATHIVGAIWQMEDRTTISIQDPETCLEGWRGVPKKSAEDIRRFPIKN